MSVTLREWHEKDIAIGLSWVPNGILLAIDLADDFAEDVGVSVEELSVLGWYEGEPPSESKIQDEVYYNPGFATGWGWGPRSEPWLVLEEIWGVGYRVSAIDYGSCSEGDGHLEKKTYDSFEAAKADLLARARKWFA